MKDGIHQNRLLKRQLYIGKTIINNPLSEEPNDHNNILCRLKKVHLPSEGKIMRYDDIFVTIWILALIAISALIAGGVL